MSIGVEATVFPVNLATVIYIFYPSGLFKRVVALHMAKKRERRQRCAARKAMMVDQLKKKAESFVTKLENRQGLQCGIRTISQFDSEVLRSLYEVT